MPLGILRRLNLLPWWKAGTGTGKTIAYTIAALPIAVARDKNPSDFDGNSCATGTVDLSRSP